MNCFVTLNFSFIHVDQTEFTKNFLRKSFQGRSLNSETKRAPTVVKETGYVVDVVRHDSTFSASCTDTSDGVGTI